jgi:hypothetical protein
MSNHELPTQTINQEQLDVIDSFFEQPLVIDIMELYSLITPNTTQATDALENGNYDFTQLIFNNSNDRAVIESIKNQSNGVFQELKKHKRTIEKGDKINDLELRLRYEKLLDIEECCKSIRLILQIKFFSDKNQPDTVQNLSNELRMSYERIYDRVDNTWTGLTLNSEVMIEVYELCKEKNPELWKKISLKITPHLNTHWENSSPKIQEFEKLNDIFISPKLDLLCPDQLLDIQNPSQIVDSTFMLEQVQIAIENIYKNLGYTPTNSSKWTARIRDEDPDKTTFSAEQSTREVIIPAKSRSIAQFKAVLYHEVFIHALRQINSERLGLQKMLPDYLVFEEGLASTLQSIVEGKDTISFGKTIIPNLIALSEIGLKIDEIYDLYSVKYTTDKQQKMLKNNMIRMLRGGTGVANKQGVNCIYPKDIAYSLGARKVYDLVNKLNDPETDVDLKTAIEKVFSELSCCKFDAFNQLHIRYLISHDIIKFTESEKFTYLKMISS